MTAQERGFLLLTSSLGDPDRKPLTVAQFRELTKRMYQVEIPAENRELEKSDLIKIGCDKEMAERILRLLSQTEQLDWYLSKGKQQDCFPLARNNPDYPDQLRKCLGMEAPGVLWTKGDRELLQRPAVSLVGSRDLNEDNYQFAVEVGRQAALQGYVLISGNARGADRAAQESCLEHGGEVIKVVADVLEEHGLKRNVLYVSEESFDLPFSAARALQRNRIIHSLGQIAFVAQCAFGKGGTWDGTLKNLRNNWSPVLCFDDGSEATLELKQMGATVVSEDALTDFEALLSQQPGKLNV